MTRHPLSPLVVRHFATQCSPRPKHSTLAAPIKQTTMKKWSTTLFYLFLYTDKTTEVLFVFLRIAYSILTHTKKLRCYTVKFILFMYLINGDKLCHKKRKYNKIQEM